MIGQQKRNEIKMPAAKKEKYIVLKPGQNSDTLSIQIKNPMLCWSNGLGNPYLYYYSATLSKKQVEIDQSSLNFGLRTIELVQENDSAANHFILK